MASSRPRVGYLGPEGTFSEEALLSSAGPELVEPVPLGSIRETVAALRECRVDWSIVPIENSLEGSLGVTLDLIAGEPRDLEVVGEVLLRVSHSLIGPAAVELERIETVTTHPQVPGQCAAFLRTELPGARVLPSSSTAEAVRQVVAAGERSRAAIGTLLAARIYGGTVLREGVEDRGDNETRFVWIARAGGASAPPLRAAGGGRKTSLVFWGPGADSPGWLVGCLDEFARRGINLTKIESRTRRERLGSYMFFVDLEGDIGSGAVGDAVAGLAARCEEVRVLGSYPSGTPGARAE
ncbi:MAG TPA: prephenate dehydratase [Solirubrobacteraceae bacterium]|jgi:prephenate dehydratase|nr:prephenate dehydratase [Solirubrobacteraceae bacterium]